MTTFFNATLSTKDEINEYLTDKEVGSSHISEDGSNIYIKQLNGNLSESLLNNDTKDYLNSIDVSSIEKIISAFIINVEFKNFFDCSEYSINIVSSRNFKVNCSDNKPSIIVTSLNNGNYFDLVGYSSTKALTYNSGRIDGFKHSGDKFFTENIKKYLYHSITPYSSSIESSIVIAASGYNMLPLHKLIRNNPVIMCLDHTLKTINIVACPIDKATIGKATLSFFLSCKYKNNVINITVIEPKYLCNIDTGDTSINVMKKVKYSLNAFNNTEIVVDKIPVQRMVVNKKETSSTFKNILEKSCFQFSDCNIFIDICKSTNIDTFNGFGHKSSRKNDIKIPFEYGPCSGSKSLVLGKYPEYPITYDEISLSHVIHNVSLEGYDYFTNNTNEFVGNGIFIIHLTLDEFKMISETKIHALSIMGPRSLVLVKSGNKYFYYRGQAEHFPSQEFGTEITDFIKKITHWLETPLKFPTCSRKDDTSVFVFSYGFYYKVSFSDFLKIPDNMTKDDKDDFFANILYVMDQFGVSCTSEQLDSISKKILIILNKETDLIKKLLKEKIKQSYIDYEMEGMIIFAKELKKCKNKFNQDNHYILSKLNNFVSQKGVISKNHSLERINKKAIIKKNVTDVKKMSLHEIFENALDENGAIILNIDTTKLRNVLVQLSKFNIENMKGYISSEKFVSNQDIDFNCLNVSTRSQILDDEIIKVIAEVTKLIVHNLQGSSYCIALPSTDYEYSTCIPIPLRKEFMTSVAPDFKKLANDINFASFRISLRNTIANANSTRDLKIPEDSTLLGTIICMIVLESLETFTKEMSGPPEEGSTRQEIIRGLLGFVLTTMASGINGQLKCWEVFSKKPSIPETLKSWKITQRIMLQARFAGWITPKILRKYKIITKNYIAFAANKIVA